MFDFLNTRTGLLLWQNRFLCSNNWIFGLWLGLLGVFPTSSNFWIQFFPPITFKENLWRRSRWRIYFLVYDFSRSHHDCFRDRSSWERVMKDDCALHLSKVDVDPIHSVLLFLPCFMFVPCKTRCIQVNFIWIFMFLVHWIHRREEYRLSFAQILSFWYQSLIHDGV